MKHKLILKVTIFDLFIILLSTTGLSYLILLVLHIFQPVVAIVISGLIIITIYLLFKATSQIQVLLKGIPIPLIIILLIALALRLPPYHYIMGGQDQGTYVNMAHQYNKQKALTYKDNFRAGLTKAQQALYDQENPYLMPSFNYLDRGSSIYAMNFYPMHPAFMAIFEYFGGKEATVYSTVFFSLLSIIAFYLLATELAGQRHAGYITALLLALNPASSFFAKFPVGESVALTFTSLSFYYLLKYYKTIKTEVIPPNPTAIFYLLVSILTMNCFFYTRMTGFLYIPIYFGLTLLTILFIHNKTVVTQLLGYFAMIIVSFGFSYLYYLKFLPQLFFSVYSSVFISGLFKRSSDIKIIIIALVSIVITVITYKYREYITQQIRSYKQGTPHLFKLMYLFIIVFLGITVYLNIKDVNYRQSDLALAPEKRNYYAVQKPIDILQHINMYSLATYVTPWGLLFYFGFILWFSYQKQESTSYLQLIFIAISLYFIAINSVLLTPIRYQYYDLRYQFSEAIPYTLLIIGIGYSYLITAKHPHTKAIGQFKIIAGVFLLTTTCIYFLIFSAIQTIGAEGPQSNLYTTITATVTNKDILFLHRAKDNAIQYSRFIGNFNLYSMAPFKYYYDLNTFIIEPIELLQDQNIRELKTHAKNLYLLSDTPLKIPGILYDEQAIEHKYNYYNVEDSCVFHTYSFLPQSNVRGMALPKAIECLTPPYKFYTKSVTFYFYRVEL